MPQSQRRHVEHEITVSTSAEAAFRLIAQAERWPEVFPPTIHVEHLEQKAGSERLRIWATANGAVKNWTSRRTLDPQRLRVDFAQEVSTPPIAAMAGAWLV